jgi:hypothetical protein
MISGDRIGQPAAREVMVIVGPSRRIGNVARKCGRGQHLCKQRIGIQGDGRHDPIELGWRIRRRHRGRRRNLGWCRRAEQRRLYERTWGWTEKAAATIRATTWRVAGEGA